MLKQDKEIKIAELRTKEIEAIDKDMTASTYKQIGILGAIFAFLFNNQLLSLEKYLVFAFLYFLVGVFILMLYQRNSYVYIEDCYTSLSLAIENDRLYKYRIPEFHWYNSYVYRRIHPRPEHN